MFFTEWVHFDAAAMSLSWECLSSAERAIAAGFQFPQRRASWLAGRLAAKRAASRCLRGLYGISAALSEIEFAADGLGAPVLSGECARKHPEAGKLAVSIAHSEPWAVAVAGGGDCRGVGIDLEAVSSRSRSWKEMAFHPREEAFQSDDGWTQTKSWTSKEAVLKALGLGLNVDLHEVRLSRKTVTLCGRARRRYKEMGAGSLECKSWPRENMAVSMAVLH